MKKVLDFLEAKVQWVALGLGVLYMLYMAYLYLIASPVQVAGIAPEPLSPGDVDPYIVKEVAEPLYARLSKPAKIQLPSVDLVPAFRNKMGDTTAPASAWQQMYVFVPHEKPIDVSTPTPPNTPNTPNTPNNPSIPAVKVAALPKIAPA